MQTPSWEAKLMRESRSPPSTDSKSLVEIPLVLGTWPQLQPCNAHSRYRTKSASWAPIACSGALGSWPTPPRLWPRP